VKRPDAPADAAADPLIPGDRPSFVAQLRFKDLQRLRQIVRRVHMRHYPGERCTDREADRIIESFGPETCEKMIARAVRRGLLA
jgi:hypothetical protein